MDNKQTTSQQPATPLLVPTPPVPPTSSKPQQTINPVVNLSEKNILDIGEETIKYSIRTMAQDLERARKENLYPTAVGIKSPSIPPSPPQRILQPKPIPSIKPSVTPPSIKPIAEIPLKTPVIPSPIISAIKRESLPSLTASPIIPPTLKREITPPSELPIAPKPSMPSAVPPYIPSTPITRPAIIPVQKKSLLPSLPQLNIIIKIIIVAIALLSSVGVSYWWFFIKQAPTPPTQQQPIEQIPPTENIPPVITEPILPEKISQTDADLIIETSTKDPSPETTSSLIAQISSSAKQLSDKQLGRVLIKYSATVEKSYLSLNESLTLLKINIPNNINANIKNGEILAYSQNGQTRYGFAAAISDALATINAMKTWEKTMLNDVNNFYVDSLPIKSQNISFNDDFQNNFIIRYLNLPDPTLSIAWAESNEKQMFIVSTSKDMTYKVIGIKEMPKPVLKTYPSGTLVRAKNDTRIYRIIDDKKLWIPSIRAFLDSGYNPHSEIEITPEELNNFENVKYAKIVNDKNVYELKNDKKYLASNAASLPQQEIKIVTSAELNAYPIGK